jgi:hypothetical protein
MEVIAKKAIGKQIRERIFEIQNKGESVERIELEEYELFQLRKEIAMGFEYDFLLTSKPLTFLGYPVVVKK